jgi:hypothetical protein
MAFLDQFFCTSTVNSEEDNVCPQEGHLLLYGLIMSFTDLSILILAILDPHLPHITSTDIARVVVLNSIKEVF